LRRFLTIAWARIDGIGPPRAYDQLVFSQGTTMHAFGRLGSVLAFAILATSANAATANDRYGDEKRQDRAT